MARKSRPNVPIAANKAEKKRTALIRRAAGIMELPADLFAGMSHIELSGNREAVVDGCNNVLEFDENVVRLSVGKHAVCFKGRGLILKELTKNSVVVEGYIISIEFVNA